MALFFLSIPIFFISGPELEEQKLLILRKEIQLHVCLSGLTHEADQLKLQRCLRSQLKSSAEAAIILEQSRALQVNLVVYDQNHYFGLGPTPKPKPKLANIITDTVTNTKHHFKGRI